MGAQQEIPTRMPLAQPKWHLLYYALALFAILAMSTSLFLTHTILNNYGKSNRDNQFWSDRAARYGELERLVGDVSAPGNDVFDSRNAKAEEQRLNTAIGAFDKYLTVLRQDSPPGDHTLDSNLTRIASSVANMALMSRRTFAEFAAGDYRSAGSHMAAMDRIYANALASFRAADLYIQNTQRQLFRVQDEAGDRLRRLELVVVALIILIIGAVVAYGQKISKVALRNWAQQEAQARGLQEGIAARTADLESALKRENTARQEAEGANRLKDEFLATLSHELRTPLTAILGWADLLREGLHGGESDHALEVIIRNAKAQTNLVDELLDVSRIMTGRVPIETKVQSVLPVLSEAIEAALPAAQNKNITLTSQLDREVDFIAIDATRFRQVIANLLTNALKFTPSGGAVHLALSQTQDDVLISVADNGQGISEAFLPRVFQRFSQADSSTMRQHGGLGLGLAIVKDLTELHGGRVFAASPGVGRGSTFTVQIPKAKAAVDLSSRPRLVKNRRELRGWHVLAVEDDLETLRFLKTGLQQEGAIVHTAQSVAEALGAIRQRPMQLMISDIGLPDEDGVALMRKICVDPDFRGRVSQSIALTAYAREVDQRTALSAGFDAFVAKPTTISHLLTVVDRHEPGAAL